MGALLLAIILAIAAASVVTGVGDARGGDEVVSLPVLKARTPPVRHCQIKTSGTFPQVSGTGLDLARVNRGIRRALIDDERRFASLVRLHPSNPPPCGAHGPWGEYVTAPKISLVSASSVVVSALIPTTKIMPGLNRGSEWFSFTVDAKTGQRVRLGALFAHPASGVRTLASAARRQLVRDNLCVRNSVDANPTLAHGFDPSFNRYRYFALLTGGIAIGFPVDRVGGAVCGRVDVTVPYSVVRPYLSTLGQRLIRGTRKPRR